MKIGYAFLADHYKLSIVALRCEAVATSAVNRLIKKDKEILVPEKVLLTLKTPLDHLLFALKNEGIHLEILAQILPLMEQSEVQACIDQTPTGTYVRKLGYLWELFTGKTLQTAAAKGGYVDLFDPSRYLTGQRRKNAKWQIYFNGLGNERYCPVVERTALIEHYLKTDLLEETQRFIEEIGPINADRALQWAYLSETESSFEIEGEAANYNKAERFIRLLQHAHDDQTLTEEYLCELQHEVVSNPFAQAFSYRTEQNWLRQNAPGVFSVSYVPPDPDLLDRIMTDFLAMANTMPVYVDPIVAASVTSFGFVYLHPFMDGNGRLSRFLFHQQLCRSGRLKKGLVLPVSIAMKEDEVGYLTALNAFSKPCRSLWSVKWIDSDRFDFQFNGNESSYRFWNATEQVEFGFRMADRALNTHLKDEVLYLERFDRIYRAMNDRYDIRQNTLFNLINRGLDNQGVISKNLRKRYVYEVPEEAFDCVERLIKEELDPKQD